jgi:hypothetical protein
MTSWPILLFIMSARPLQPEVLAAVIAASDGRPGRMVRLLSVPAVRKALAATEKGVALPADLHRSAKSQLLEQTFLALLMLLIPRAPLRSSGRR